MCKNDAKLEQKKTIFIFPITFEGEKVGDV